MTLVHSFFVNAVQGLRRRAPEAPDSQQHQDLDLIKSIQHNDQKEKMIKDEFIQQYAHSWRVFEKLVKDFDADAWLQTGRGAITPPRLALHILLGTQYYLDDKMPFQYPSGKPFEIDWQKIKTDDLPSQKDILAFIHEMMSKTEKWLIDLEYSAENLSFPWAGKTQLGVVIFLLRHSQYHIGELSSLLNESKDGGVEDHYVKAL